MKNNKHLLKLMYIKQIQKEQKFIISVNEKTNKSMHAKIL